MQGIEEERAVTVDIELASKMYDSKEYWITEINKAAGVSKTSLYRYIAQRK